MDAWFRGDRTVMNDEEFETVMTEYVDTAGLFQSEEFEKVAYIHFLNNRINTVKISIRLQREFIKNFQVPYLPDLQFLMKFGYSIKWNNNIEDFSEKLNKIEQKESKYISQLEAKIKDLTDFRAKKTDKEVSPKESRGSFIRTLNSLGKIGYKIDNDKTTVEELAYMIKQQTEEVESLKSNTTT